MIGRSACSSAISRVASRSVSTSFLHCGITAIFGISAPSSCIFTRRPTISSLSGVLSKSWLDATTFTPCACAPSMISFTTSSPVNASTSTRSTSPVAAAFLFSSAYASASIAFSPPSLEVRNVKRIGVSPSAGRRSFNTSSTCAKSNTPSNQSTRHSTTSSATSSKDLAAARISSFVFPTIGTQIFGTPSPILTPRTSTYLLMSVFSSFS